ncbi:MAG TPA: NUDIX hydrolase [Gaiellaceae bacterium]|nr:NUDIX hydrolase [Gaiellaceae bacterium]
MTEFVRSAGGLVLRRVGGRLEVLLVHRPAYGDWTFPKGKLEPGEGEPDAALREVEEETGLRCLLGRERGHTEYLDSQGRPKTARYWAMVAPGGEPAAANEVDEVRWVEVEEAAGALSYDRDRALLQELPPDGGPVFLVRHAKAGNRDKWTAPDELRPLTKPGRRQAQAIAGELAAAPVAALVSSRYARCVQTLEPLGEALGLPVQQHDALAEGAPTPAALELIRSVAVLGMVVLSTHGDVQANAILALADAGIPLEGKLDFAKGSAWELQVRGGEIVSGRYRPPPA